MGDLDVALEHIASSKHAQSLFSGALGGVAGVVFGYPFDLVKVRQQTATQKLSVAGTVKSIMKAEGFAGLYRGVVPPLIGIVPICASSFWAYESIKDLIRRRNGISPDGLLSIPQIAQAGFLSAIPIGTIVGPLERIKTVMQTQKAAAPPLEVMKQIYLSGGLPAVFRGTFLTMARDAPGSILYFGTYETVKRSLEATEIPTFVAVVSAGGCAGLAMWVPVFPVDTVKSIVQASIKKVSAVSVAVQLSRSPAGFWAFYPGVGAALLRSVVTSAATFSGLEVGMRMFKVIFSRDQSDR